MRVQRLALLGPSLALLTLVWCEMPPVYAAVQKTLTLDSEPRGAQVFLRQAGRETLLGTTPFDYQAEFHSEQSILRFVFKKPGHKPVTLEVQSNRNPVLAKFEQVKITASPDSHQAPRLRGLQEKLNPTLDKEIPTLLGADPELETELTEPIRVADFDGEPGLMIRLTVGRVKGIAGDAGSSRQEGALKALWARLGKTLVLPLAAHLREQHELRQIALRVGFSEQRILFGVDAKLETTVEMQCVGGNEYWTEPDFVCDYKGCNTRLVNKSRYNPCLQKVPVTKTEMKFNPQSQSIRDQANAYYVLPFSLLEKEEAQDTEKLYDKIGVLLTDSTGKLLKQQGTVPKSLSVPSR